MHGWFFDDMLMVYRASRSGMRTSGVQHSDALLKFMLILAPAIATNAGKAQGAG